MRCLVNSRSYVKRSAVDFQIGLGILLSLGEQDGLYLGRAPTAPRLWKKSKR